MINQPRYIVHTYLIHGVPVNTLVNKYNNKTTLIYI